MKINELKKLVKSAVKEAIQEELKEILLEAVKGTKVIQPQQMVESRIPTPSPQTPIMNSQPQMSPQEKREAYKNILGETAASFNTNNVPTFRPNPGMDMTNGALPEGNVGMDQIMNLMNSK